MIDFESIRLSAKAVKAIENLNELSVNEQRDAIHNIIELELAREYKSSFEVLVSSDRLLLNAGDLMKLQIIAEKATDEEKIKLMRISTKGLKKELSKREKLPLQRLREILAKKWVDRSDSVPLDLDAILNYSSLDYTEEKIKRLLRSSKLPPHVATEVANMIEEDYVELDEFEAIYEEEHVDD